MTNQFALAFIVQSGAAENPLLLSHFPEMSGQTENNSNGFIYLAEVFLFPVTLLGRGRFIVSPALKNKRMQYARLTRQAGCITLKWR